jgi:NarL family two-component system response regulator LiaR
MLRSGLKNFLYGYEWLELAGEASSGAEAVEFCSTHEVDVVLMDMMMPGMNGWEATRRIIALGKPVKIIILTSFHEQDLVEDALKAGATSYLLKNIILTSFHEQDLVEDALKAGATSYLLKNVNAEELASAIQDAYTGKSTLAPEATEALIQATLQRRDIGFDLTRREKEVLELLVDGKSNNEIAILLSISLATVRFHLTNIYTKFGAKNRIEAVTLALDHHLITK